MSKPTQTRTDENAPRTRVDDCDGCDERAEGTSHYQNSAVVLHVCHKCENAAHLETVCAKMDADQTAGY